MNTTYCMHSGASPSKENKGGFNTVLNVSAEIGTGDGAMNPPLQECSTPGRCEGSDDVRQDPKHCTDRFLGQCRRPASLQQSSCFTVSEQHWTD